MSKKYLDNLPEQVQTRVAAAMVPGENVLWCDKSVAKAAWHEWFPANARTLGQRKFLLVATIAIGLYLGWLFLSFMAGWFHIVFVEGIDNLGLFLVILLAGAFICLLGTAAIVFIFIPFLARLGAKERYYILTNRNVMIVQQFTSQNVLLTLKEELATLREEPALERLNDDGVGDIVFDYTWQRVTGTESGIDTDMYHDLGFLSCPDAKHVIGLLQEAISKRKPEYELETMKEMQEDYQGYLRKTGRL